MMRLSGIESRMAWHGGLYRHGRFLCTAEELKAWRTRLPSWIEEEQARLDSGELPSRPTLRALLGESGKPHGSLPNSPQSQPSERDPRRLFKPLRPRSAPTVGTMGAALDEPSSPALRTLRR